MQPVIVTVSHSLRKSDVLARLKPALGQAAATFPVMTVEQEVWTDDRMDFRVRALGQTIVGNVLVGERDVRLELQLPWFLAKFADAIRTMIGKRAQILLGKT